MHRTGTVVIGAGQAGLATSRLLTEAGRDHVVLDRGRLAERWRSERWDSLRLLTPNWMSRLPGWAYQGPDPDGFMTVSELLGYFDTYARSFSAPVHEQTTVKAVHRTDRGYRVTTDQGSWQADCVVVATGGGTDPFVPPAAHQLANGVFQLPSNAYRNPDDLPDGGVLVVGGSASGVQLADELHRSGRPVVLATGNHTQMPRSYRGMDIYWWMERVGLLGVTIDEMPDLDAARRAPSLQLVGRTSGARLDLRVLQDQGVRVTGRLIAADGHHVAFADDLASTIASSKLRMHRTLDTIDRYVEARGCEGEFEPPDRPAPARPGPAPTELDLRAAGISTVLWATGFRCSYPWLHVPILDMNGEIRHRRGVTEAPGLYVLGLRFLHRRNSHFIDGVRHDARYIVDRIATRTTRQTEFAA